MVITVLVRRLREGRTYEDFRAAWEPESGLGVPTRVVTGQRVDDEREIVTIGLIDLDRADAEALLTHVQPDQDRRHDRIEEVIEPEIVRAFYVGIGDDEIG